MDMFSVVYQDFARYQISFADNIRLGNRTEMDEARFSQVLSFNEIGEIAQALPNGSTPACALLTITNATSAVLFSKKYRIILSAFVPSPEAKIAIFFMMFSILVHIKQKNVQNSAFICLNICSAQEIFIPLQPQRK